MLFCRDDHGFSPLHWACREGRSSVVDMLIMRGARINVMNRGDDTPLHLAASHGHRDIVGKVELAQTSNKMNISRYSDIDLIAKPASCKELKTRLLSMFHISYKMLEIESETDSSGYV